MYPAILYMHHRFVKKWEKPCLRIMCCWPCILCNRKKNNVDQAPKESSSPTVTSSDGDETPEIERQLSSKMAGDISDYRAMERFLGFVWSKWITKFKIPILCFFVCLFVTAAIFGTQMEAQSEDEKWFADAHYMQKAQDLLSGFIFINFDILTVSNVSDF